MRKIAYLVGGSLLFGIFTGCGSKTNSGSDGGDVIQKYNFHVQGDPVISSTTLPLQFTDGEWSSKQAACIKGGYDLVPYAGQEMSLTKWALTENYFLDNPVIVVVPDPGTGQVTTATTDHFSLDLWTISKNHSTICSYVSSDSQYFDELYRQGFFDSGIFAVNDTHIR